MLPRQAGIGAGSPRLGDAELWAALSEVPDPEMPIVNLVELGIVRSAEWQAEQLVVTITPTFAACPAYAVIDQSIRERLQAAGVADVDVRVQHNPAWTTEWMTAAARSKLQAAGLAPPPRHRGNVIQVLMEPVACPRCGSHNTTLQNNFGTTPCRMIYTCVDCKEPFEMFKPL
ncbi:MAG: phenylacetate-CoA oxygenase subunit PaaJ [Anaerolineales bacterium]|nr:phenylacetate-CoA oxygenase subunit PaaJ [Anaerolineales bacterium]